jgi:hypothetical protein
VRSDPVIFDFPPNAPSPSRNLGRAWFCAYTFGMRSVRVPLVLPDVSPRHHSTHDFTQHPAPRFGIADPSDGLPECPRASGQQPAPLPGAHTGWLADVSHPRLRNGCRHRFLPLAHPLAPPFPLVRGTYPLRFLGPPLPVPGGEKTPGGRQPYCERSRGWEILAFKCRCGTAINRGLIGRMWENGSTNGRTGFECGMVFRSMCGYAFDGDNVPLMSPSRRPRRTGGMRGRLGRSSCHGGPPSADLLRDDGCTGLLWICARDRQVATRSQPASRVVFAPRPSEECDSGSTGAISSG